LSRTVLIPLNKGDARKGKGIFLFDTKDLKQRGLIFTGRYLPYNPHLIERAKELRKHLTPAERKLWWDFLRGFSYRMFAQRPIDNYIVDFYCPSLKIVIEIDGERHFTEEGKTYDGERDAILTSYGLTVLRFTNHDVINNFESVCRYIEGFIQ
jgi:very-short-patch-repair endonuclease